MLFVKSLTRDDVINLTMYIVNVTCWILNGALDIKFTLSDLYMRCFSAVSGEGVDNGQPSIPLWLRAERRRLGVHVLLCREWLPAPLTVSRDQARAHRLHSFSCCSVSILTVSCVCLYTERAPSIDWLASTKMLCTKLGWMLVPVYSCCVFVCHNESVWSRSKFENVSKFCMCIFAFLNHAEVSGDAFCALMV